MFDKKEVLLVRHNLSKHGTQGTMFLDRERIAETLENPWLNNQPNISCIPSGKYIVESYSSKKYPNHWEIKDVKGRAYILIHEGNYTKDTRGCVLVGNKYGNLGNRFFVRNSKVTLKKLKDILPDSFKLIIEEL